VAPSGSSGNHYQFLKNARVITTGTTATNATDTATVVDTAISFETATATAI